MKLKPITVENGEVLDCHPDNAGIFNYGGHLCQQPELVAEVENKVASRRLSDRKRHSNIQPKVVDKAEETDDEHDKENQKDAAVNQTPKTGAATPTSSNPSASGSSRRKGIPKKVVPKASTAAPQNNQMDTPVRKRARLSTGATNGQEAQQVRYLSLTNLAGNTRY